MGTFIYKLDKTQKALTMKKKIDKLDLTKIKIFCSSEGATKKY